MAARGASRAVDAGPDRELVVLADGPWARHWYWRDDLEAMQAASRHVGHPDTVPAGELRRYRLTDTYQPHPHNTERFGRVYRFGPAQDTPSTADRAAEQVAKARAAVTAAVVPAPRRPLDDETGERRAQHAQHVTESAGDGVKHEGVLW